MGKRKYLWDSRPCGECKYRSKFGVCSKWSIPVRKDSMGCQKFKK